MMDQRMARDLDDYITGHWGEDQFREFPDDVEDPVLIPEDPE